MNYQETPYNVDNYNVRELIDIFKKYFNLNFDMIQTYEQFMNLLITNINIYKTKHNNLKNILFFEQAKDKIDNYIRNRPYSIKYLLSPQDENIDIDGNYNEINTNDKDNTDDDNDDIDNYKNDIEKEYTDNLYNKLPSDINDLQDDDINKLYNTFNLKTNSLSIDDLEKSYGILKNKITDIDNDKTRQSLMNYINKSYQLLRKYIINKLYGNTFTNTNNEMLDNEISLNENRYNLLSNPSVIQNNQSQIIQKNIPGSQDVFVNTTPSDVMNPIRRNHITSILNIDTFLRSDFLNTNPSNYIQEFAEPINNVVSMSLASIEMPNIWYTFSEARGSNYMNITFKNFRYNNDISNNITNVIPNGEIRVYDVSYNIVFPDGNYTSEEITVTMNNLFKYYGEHWELLNDPFIDSPFKNPIFYLRMAVDNITGKTTFRIITENFDYTNAQEERTYGCSPYEEKNFNDTFYNPAYSPDMVIEFNFLNESQLALYNELVDKKFDPSINEVVYNLNNVNITLCEQYIKSTKQKAYGLSSITPEKIMYNTAGWMFGFRKPIYVMTINDTFFDPYTTSQVVIYKGFLSSEGIYGGLINTYLFLSIDDFNNNYKRTVISNSENFVVSNNILAKIPIGSGSNTLLVQDDKINKTREYFGPVNIKKMRIKLLDRFGNVVDLNNNNYTFTLQLTQLY